MRAITVSDDQFARLQALAEIYHCTPERLVSAWLDALLAPGHQAASALPLEEYDRRWKAFMRLVGSIQHGKPLTNEEIDELISEEATQSHDAAPTNAGGRPATDRTA
jgi:hypothetical protein